MVRPEDISGFIDNRWFSSLAGAGDWIINILVSILLLGIFWFVWVTLEHKLKITYFPIYGTRPEVLAELRKKGPVTMQDLREHNVELGHPKKARGRDYKVKGVHKFSIMVLPNVFRTRKLAPLEYSKRYSDGVWFLRPSKDVWIPIERPRLSDAVNLNVPEPDMDLWQQAEEAEIRRRTQDEDSMKRQLYMTVAIIIGAFVLAGVIIWLSMSFAGRSIDSVLAEVKPMTNALQSLVESKGPG